MNAQPAFNFDAVTFSAPIARELKEEGQRKAETARSRALNAARQCAEYLAAKFEEVDIDMVQKELMAMGYTPEELGNSAGGVFRGWKLVRYKKSERVGNHGREIRVWRKA
jgi:hypothetical protein